MACCWADLFLALFEQKIDVCDAAFRGIQDEPQSTSEEVMRCSELTRHGLEVLTSVKALG